MLANRDRYLAVFVLTLAFTPAVGQTATGACAWDPFAVTPPGCKTASSLRQPPAQPFYTAEFKTTRVQTLANGTTITRESTETRALDSQGRSMVATTEALPNGTRQQFTYVREDDPVAGTQVTWNSRTKEARVVKLPPQEQRQGCWQSDSGEMHLNYGPAANQAGLRGNAAHPPQTSANVSALSSTAVDPKREDLGTATIQGLVANGHRSTFTTPVGRVGNDQPLVRTVEMWFAASLGLEVRRIIDDPQTGRSDRELVNLDASEPPAATFQPPEDYKVNVEELHPVACAAGSTP